jgi:N-acetylglucosaminyldiphosphoundecaprenol N-acetyl-beta-D-mannosaminyltransferase
MKLFGVEIDERSREEIFESILERVESSRQTFVVTANAVIMLRVRKDPNYKRAVEMADIVIPDGTGIVLASRIKGREIHKYPGVELSMDLLKVGKKRGWKFYLLGAREEVVRKLSHVLIDEGINVVGYHHGYFDGKGPVEEIKSLEPDVVLVAMGVPKQEMWIAQNIDEFKKGLFIGVGGTFDVLAGFKKRAPKWMVNLGLEWLYRIFQDPLRRWKIPFELAQFLFYAFREGKG